ncbi:MAG: beta strand repeat-containing protein, partial [Alphaproteobacteria bacterium]
EGAGDTLDLLSAISLKISDIEAIDLAGAGSTVTLDQVAVLGLSGTSNSLRVTGDATTTLNLIDAGNWTVTAAGATTTIQNGVAEIIFDSNMITPPGSLLLLAALDGADGFRIDGEVGGDLSGTSVSFAGDINNDGFDDVIIGAYGANTQTGEAFVVFGNAVGFAPNLALSALNGANGFRLRGVDSGDRAGSAVSGAGDINGDGIDDLIIGAPYADLRGGFENSGEAYVVFGKTAAFAATVDLGTLDGADGLQINGIDAGGQLGAAVGDGGDLNGDGIDDLAVGAPRSQSSGFPNDAGLAFVIQGKASPFNASISAGDGHDLIGRDSGDFVGTSVGGGFDIHGDGINDLLLGAPGANDAGLDKGEIHLRAGGSIFNLNGANLQATGFIFTGLNANDKVGQSVSNAGDLNADGFDDIILSAHGADPVGQVDAGEAYVIFGTSNLTQLSRALDLSTLDGSNGFKIEGVNAGDFASYSVSQAGDVNGDGFDDFIIGNIGFPGGANPSEAFVIFGKSAGFDASIALDQLDGVDGFRIDGIGDRIGTADFSVSGAGDINGDGFDDVVVGSGSAGKSFVVFGADTGAATGVSGALAETLTSTGVIDDVFIGGGGNDILNGGDGGLDVLRGGEGDDTLIVGDDFRRIDGGAGTDVLELSATGIPLDLVAAGSQNIFGIEAINLSGGGTNLALDKKSALQLSDTSNTVTITGDGSSNLFLTDAGWVTTAIDATNTTLTNGEADIVVSRAVNVVTTNTAPVATSESFVGLEDNDTIENVLANNGAGADFDADGDAVFVTLARDVSDGTLALNGDGSFTYTPNENFNGADEFDYD